MAEILVVDDERVLREGMKALLTSEGHEVRTARDGNDALLKFNERRPQLVLLDVMMPKMNGFRTCEEIRKLDQTVPVIFLTGKDAETDQVRGIGLGADDYISKTASDGVLLARIQRALSRAEAYDSQKVTVRFGKATIDFSSRLVSVGKTNVRLTKTEIDIIRVLMQDRGNFMSKDFLIDQLRGKGYACEDGVLYTHVYNLRKKLGDAADLIVCDYANGYMLAR